MFEVKHQSIVRASPRQVWNELTAFDRYGEWTSAASLTGGQPGDAASYAIHYRARGMRRWRLKLDGVTIANLSCRQFALRTGFPSIFEVTISFDLGRRHNGTDLKQMAQIDGLLTWPLKRQWQRLFELAFEGVDRDLRLRVEKPVPPQAGRNQRSVGVNVHCSGRLMNGRK